MLKKNGGRVIFISSESGQHIPAEMIPYGMKTIGDGDAIISHLCALRPSDRQ
jgi:hypothetical protein